MGKYTHTIWWLNEEPQPIDPSKIVVPTKEDLEIFATYFRERKHRGVDSADSPGPASKIK